MKYKLIVFITSLLLVLLVYLSFNKKSKEKTQSKASTTLKNTSEKKSNNKKILKAPFSTNKKNTLDRIYTKKQLELTNRLQLAPYRSGNKTLTKILFDGVEIRGVFFLLSEADKQKKSILSKIDHNTPAFPAFLKEELYQEKILNLAKENNLKILESNKQTALWVKQKNSQLKPCVDYHVKVRSSKSQVSEESWCVHPQSLELISIKKLGLN